MSEERNKDDEVEILKRELKELVNCKIGENKEFISSPKKGTLPILIAVLSFLTVSGLGVFWIIKPYYTVSIYLVVIIWPLSSIGSLKKAQNKVRQKGMIKQIILNLEKIKVAVNWYFKWAKPIIYSLWTLFLLSIPMLLIIGERRWWMWTPAILFVIFLPVIAKGGSQSITDFLDEQLGVKKKHKTLSITRVIVAILLFLILAIIGIYVCYRVIQEVFLIALSTPYSFFELLLTMILILVFLVSLSEYISMRFTITDVSKQNNALHRLKTEVDRIKDAKTLEKIKKNLLKWYSPTVDSFLVFFNYYYLMPTPHTFEVDEEEEESNRD